MPRIARFLLTLSLLALTAALPVHAQEGSLPEDQQAILDQLRQAVAAAQDYESFVTTASGLTSTDQIVTMGDSESTSDQSITLNRVTNFTHDAEGAANAQTTFEVETTAKGFGEENPVTTTIQAEARVVGGAVYVRAEGETGDGAMLPPLPEGWVQLTAADEWPALSLLGLDRLLENPTDPELFDPSFYNLLDHASEVWSEMDDAGKPIGIGVRVMGDDLIAALTATAEATGANETAATLVAGLTEGSWEIIVEFDEAGRVARIQSQGFLQWLDFDLTAIQPTLPPGSLLTQFQMNESEVKLSEINAPREPVEAPPLGAS